MRHFGGWLSEDKKAYHYQLPSKTPLKDWYGIFAARWKAKFHFNAIFVDLGSSYIRCDLLPD